MPQPFPTTPVLDTFNRADGALGGLWLGNFKPGGYPILVVASNQMSPATAWKSAYWNQLFDADQEIFCTAPVIPTVGGNPNWELHCRGQNVGLGTINSYFWRGNSGTSYLIKTVSGTETVIGGTYGAMANGDVIGLQVVGSKIGVYRNGTLLQTVTDTSVVGPGYLGVVTGDDATTRFDNFGGGAYTIGGRTRRGYG